MATCNGLAYLGEQLDSIAAQTRPPDEVIIHDDLSDDGTDEFARRWLRRQSFAGSITVNDERLGAPGNFERAIAEATGDVIVLCDQDDRWLTTRLAEIERRFLAQPALGGVFSDAWIIDSASQRDGRRLWDEASFTPARRARFRRQPLRVLLQRSVVTGATLAFRADLRSLLLPVSAHGWHDEWIAVLLAAASTLDMIDQPLLEYRLHSSNVAGLSPTVRGRLRRRLTTEEVGTRAVGLFEDVRDRLAAREALDPEHEAALRGKIRFLRHRATLPAKPRPRLVPVSRELLRGSYHRYAPDLASAGFDLLYGGRVSAIRKAGS